MQFGASRQPRVSVVVTTYNRANLVCRALDSLLAQTYPDFEVVVVDDGSTDDTRAVLKRYESDSRIHVVYHDRNRGVAAAKTTGLDRVRGELTTMLDSDDELVPHALERLVMLLDELGPDYAMVFANGVDAETGKLTGVGLGESQQVTYADAISGRFRGDFWGLWRQSALGEGRLDERVPGHERILWHRIYRDHRVYYLSEPLLKCYRGGTDRVSRSMNNPERATGMALGYALYIDEFGSDLKKLDRQRLCRLHQIRAFWLLMAGKRIAALSALLKAMAIKPSIRSFLLIGSPIVPRRIIWAATKGHFS